MTRTEVSRCISPASEPGGGPRPGCQCQGCYAQPRPGEDAALYGSGRSKFYVTSDTGISLETLSREAPGAWDHSRHLAHSTIFRDTRQGQHLAEHAEENS